MSSQLFSRMGEDLRAVARNDPAAHGTLDVPGASELNMKRFQPALEELSP